MAFWKTGVEYGNLLAPADFAANQYGQVTDSQRKRLDSQVGWVGHVLIVLLESAPQASVF